MTIIIIRWTVKLVCITVVTYSSILWTVMQCIAWNQALLWEKNCKNWRYKAQKLASEVSWVADWGRKRVVPPFPFSSITNFFYPFPQLWSLVPGYCMFCWVVNKVHPDEHQLVTTQLLLLQYIDCNCYFIGTTIIIHTP